MKNKGKSAWLLAKQVAESRGADAGARRLAIMAARKAARRKLASGFIPGAGAKWGRAVTKDRFILHFTSPKREAFLDLLSDMYRPVESLDIHVPVNGMAGLTADFCNVGRSIRLAMKRIDDERTKGSGRIEQTSEQAGAAEEA